MSYAQVKKFQKLAGRPFGSLDLLNQERLKQRAMLIAEEFAEVMQAMGFDADVALWLPKEEQTDEDMFFEKIALAEDKPLDKEEMLKELCDLTVTAEGTAAELGFKFDEARIVVNENNITKVANGVKYDANGKIVKPVGYEKPKLSEFV